jgi:hypothetical protein
MNSLLSQSMLAMLKTKKKRFVTLLVTTAYCFLWVSEVLSDEDEVEYVDQAMGSNWVS